MRVFTRLEQGFCEMHPFLVSLVVPGVIPFIFSLSYLGGPLPLGFSKW